MDDERSSRKEGFGVLERAARTEDGVLGKECDAFCPGRGGRPGAKLFGFPMKVDAYLSVADSGELFEDALDDGLPEDREKRFGQMVCYRPETLAEPGSREKDVEGYLTWCTPQRRNIAKKSS
jgi:hypothetical protein